MTHFDTDKKKKKEEEFPSSLLVRTLHEIQTDKHCCLSWIQSWHLITRTDQTNKGYQLRRWVIPNCKQVQIQIFFKQSHTLSSKRDLCHKLNNQKGILLQILNLKVWTDKPFNRIGKWISNTRRPLWVFRFNIFNIFSRSHQNTFATHGHGPEYIIIDVLTNIRSNIKMQYSLIH